MLYNDAENVRSLPPPRSFTGSALFIRTFDEGMALVEETARYLDGPGRDEARSLSRKGAILYAGESMRVTTRMMQAASWLLVQRAVHDGDMEPDQASSGRYRLGSKEICLGAATENTEELLPAALRDLLVRSKSLSPHRASRRSVVRSWPRHRPRRAPALESAGTSLRR